jgi:hypothetical protein
VGEVVIEGPTGVDVPVPVSGTIVVGFCGSLLVMEMLPDALPAIAGENETFKVTLPPGVTVLGVDMPETPKGPPPTETNEISRFVPPALVSVNVPMAVVPIVALPKFKLVELALICGGAIAVPASATCSEETPVSVWTVKEPVTFPAEVASNQT